jgi:hypothetical protein
MAKVTSRGGIDRLAQSIADLESKRGQVGFFDTAHYPDGTPVAYVAAIQEFGHGPIPPRSFMRSTMAEKRAAWRQTLAQGAKQVLADRMTTEQMLEAFGMAAAGDVKEKIISIMSPALDESTIYARLHRNTKPRNTSTKPLVDTGVLLSSVESKVTDK